MTDTSADEVEFAPRRRITPARVVAALLLAATAGFFAALYEGYFPGAAAPHPGTPSVTVAIPTLPGQPAEAPKPSPGELVALPPPAPPHAGFAPQPLPPAPDPGLVEKGPQGPLPIVGNDGRQPWRVYARPFDKSDARPRVALVITGLGPAGAATESAIGDLPPSVTLAFDPYAKRLGEWIERARAQGHEVLLALPMEPNEYPLQDPGPYTLLTSLSIGENQERLQWVLSRVTGYVGLTNMMGSRFTASQVNLLPVFEELKKRGLMFVDGRTSEQSVAGSLAEAIGLPRAVVDDSIDRETTRDAIDHHLGALEDDAKRNGSALGLGYAYPLTLERVALWAKTLDAKGLALAPASALAEQKGK